MTPTFFGNCGSAYNRLRHLSRGSILRDGCRKILLGSLVFLLSLSGSGIAKERAEVDKSPSSIHRSCGSDMPALLLGEWKGFSEWGAKEDELGHRKREKSRSEVSIQDDNARIRQKCPPAPWHY
jgi:hypothetical protein